MEVRGSFTVQMESSFTVPRANLPGPARDMIDRVCLYGGHKYIVVDYRERGDDVDLIVEPAPFL